MRKESMIGSRIAEFRSNAMSRSAEFASPSHPPDAHGSLPTLVDLRIATGFARPLAGGDSTFLSLGPRGAGNWVGFCRPLELGGRKDLWSSKRG